MALGTMIIRLKLRFGRRFPYHRLCWMTWCFRVQVYDSFCWKHQEVYDRRAARRLKRTRRQRIKERRQMNAYRTER